MMISQPNVDLDFECLLVLVVPPDGGHVSHGACGVQGAWGGRQEAVGGLHYRQPHHDVTKTVLGSKGSN